MPGETAARSSTALTKAATRGGSTAGEAGSVGGLKAKPTDGEGAASLISLLMSADSCHGAVNDKDAEISGSLSAVELFWESVLAGVIPLDIGTVVCEEDRAVSSNEPEGGGTIFLVMTKEKAVAGDAGRVGGSVYIFFRTTSGRSKELVSDIKRTSPENRVVSGV